MARIEFGNLTGGGGSGTPTGTAGGQLSGTYPNPSVVGATESGGPTALDFGIIPDGTFLKRDGTSVIGSTPSGSGDVTGPSSANNDGMVVFDGVSGKVLKDLGLRHYGKRNDNPASGSEGDEYYHTTLNMHMFYDGSRAKWLSRDTITMEFGRLGNTAAGSYFRGPGGLSFSDSMGMLPFHSGTVIGIAYNRDDTDLSVFQITSAGGEIGFISSSATSGRDNTIDADFSPSSGTLGVKNKSGGSTVTDVMGWILMKWRAS
jgi:hypothetical protein